MKSMKLKLRFKHYGWIMAIFISIIAYSCNNSTKQNNNKSELAQEVLDVKEEVNEILNLEKTELKNKVDSVVTDFNKQLYEYEDKMQKGTKKINSEAEEILAELKTKRDNLTVRVGEIQKQTDKNWKEFKEELQHDSEQFASSVKDFFKDNK
jgi:hypothetical protein